MLRDYITAAERLNPPGRWLNFAGEVWLRYKYRVACWEMERQAKHAAEWRFVVLQCQDKLRQLGVDPAEQPEDITRMFEFWLAVGLAVALALLVLAFGLYRIELAGLIARSMQL